MSGMRSFQVNQKFFAYERDGTPRLLQVIDAQTLRHALEWLWEEDQHVPVPDRRGYRLPFRFHPTQDENSGYLYKSPEYNHIRFTFYSLPDKISPDAISYREEAIFLSQLRSYTCMALSGCRKAYIWSDARSLEEDAPKTIEHLSNWDLYRSLENSEQQFVVAIDEYSAISDLIWVSTHSDCSDDYKPTSHVSIPEIGKAWLFSERDLEGMNQHDLFYYLCSQSDLAFLMDCMPEDVCKEWLQDDDSEDFSDYLACLGEDLLYSHFCARLQNDPNFKPCVIHYIRRTQSDPVGTCFPPENLRRYVEQIYKVVTEQIAPLKQLLPEELFEMYVDLEELLEFLACVRRRIARSNALAPLIDEICDRLGISRFHF